MGRYVEETTHFLLETWLQATLTDYGHLLLAIILCGWFVRRYCSRVGA